MMSEKSIFCFVKFGRKEHMENLLNKGEICFTPIHNFRESIEAERGDSFESAFSIENVTMIDIKCEHPTLGTFHFKPTPDSKSRIVQFNEDPYLNFSLYTVHSHIFQNYAQHKIDKRMVEFGDYAVLIREPKLFAESIFKNLKSEGLNAKAKLIEYKNFKDCEKLDVTFFDKSEDYKHQEEYRIILKSNDYNRQIVSIGSIADYASICKSSEVVEMLWEAKYSP